jgi:hypothetical protein
VPKCLFAESTKLGLTKGFLVGGALAPLGACCWSRLVDVFIVTYMVLRSDLHRHIQVLATSHSHHVGELNIFICFFLFFLCCITSPSSISLLALSCCLMRILFLLELSKNIIQISFAIGRKAVIVIVIHDF